MSGTGIRSRAAPPRPLPYVVTDHHHPSAAAHSSASRAVRSAASGRTRSRFCLLAIFAAPLLVYVYVVRVLDLSLRPKTVQFRPGFVHEKPSKLRHDADVHFLERLEHYLPQKEYLFPRDVEDIEKKILSFDIQNPVSITFGVPVEKIAISTKNWLENHKAQCPNCQLVHDPSATVKWVSGCPMNPQKDYKEQILVCSCGKSQNGTGSGYFRIGMLKCDYDASFLNHDSFNFQDSYAHLHLTPPQYKKIHSVHDEMERYLEMPPEQMNKAVFIHSDCSYQRGAFVSRMIQHNILPIDRYGACWKNKNFTSRENWYWGESQGNRDTVKTEAFTNYKFSFALENTNSSHYFTEKRYQSFLALTIPIVWKTDNSEQYTPGENSVIYPEDHGKDARKLAEYLLKLSKDDAAYQKHLAWKKKGIKREFVKTLFKKTDFLACRICETISQNKRSCVWNPQNNDGTVIHFTGNEECNKILPKIVQNDKKILFLGDSTVWRLFDASSRPNCPAQKVIYTSRCRWIERFGMKRLPVWTLPEAKKEGPVDYGKTHPFCTDCSGCKSEFRTNVKHGSSCVHQNYIAVEFARDVEMQTTVGKTTQESLAYFLSMHDPHSVCIVSTGLHDMAIRNITDYTFGQNVEWYLNILKDSCQKVVWIELTDVATQTYFQTTPRLKKWNDMIFEKTKELDYVWVVRLFDASKSIKHLDNAHMDSSWYSALNKMLLNAIIPVVPL